jgi:serine/threonine protein kinase
VDIYSFCGETLLLELASSDLYHWSDIRHVTSKELLTIAQDAALALRDLHAIQYDSYKESTPLRGIQIHRDIRPWNFLMTHNKTLKIHDFNAGRFLPYQDNTTNVCRWKSTSKCNQVSEHVDIQSCRFVKASLVMSKESFSLELHF